jgi:phosphatidylserine/phosphatidylglycerophosphate/cardiolipin synthase-like enzyme
MQNQSWIATVVFAVIAFGGGYFAGTHGPIAGWGSQTGPNIPANAAQCYFSPGGGCTDAIVAQINSAQHSIEFQGYTFTSRPIGSALVAAHRRGVDVKVVLDAASTGDHRAEAVYVLHGGIPVYLDAKHAIAHNKVILIDDSTLITGSFNFTRAAEEDNAENVLILHNQPQIQSAYEDNFRKHLAHSEAFDGK